MSVIKTEGHAQTTEPEYQTVDQVNEVHPVFAKPTLLFPDCCHPDVLVTWQQPVPESEIKMGKRL